MRAGFPLLITGVCLVVLVGQLDESHWRGLPQALRQMSGSSLLGAALLSALSLWAVGRYDAVAHRHLGTGISDRRAHRAGIVAIALAQTLGFGLFTGAAARWRMLPSLRFTDALRLSTFVSLSFLSALAVLIAISTLLLPAPDWTTLPATLVLLALPCLVALSFVAPELRVWRWSLRLPSLTASGAILFWTAVDTTAAAGALYLLMPTAEIGFALFLPVFLMSLGAALISGTPGGVGPFELVLLASLPHVDPVTLLAAVMAFRALYYAVPATLAALMLLRPLGACVRPATDNAPVLCEARRAEVGVIRQNGGRMLTYANGAAPVWPVPQALVGLFAPVDGPDTALLTHLDQAARQENRVPCLYKVDAPLALTARRAGWCVVRIAQEAVLSPCNFDLSCRSRRGLRRKLRAAEKAGLTIETAETLPVAEMARIDRAWQARQGSARAGTMGRFDVDYLAGQQVFLARMEGRLVGFVSFHTTRAEWCLDVMRFDGAPDGTMQALVHAAIDAARAAGVPRLSLAAVPDHAPLRRRWLAPVARHVGDGAGLRQFKAGFGPRWQPLYAAAPGPLRLSLALADIARIVHAAPAPANRNTPHEKDENYELAPKLAS